MDRFGCGPAAWFETGARKPDLRCLIRESGLVNQFEKVG